MSMLDNIKNKAADLAKDNAEKIDDAIEKVGDFVDEKTGGKYADKVDQAQEFAKDQVDKIAGA